MDSEGRKAFIKVATEETCPQTRDLSFSQNRGKKIMSVLFKLEEGISVKWSQRNLSLVSALRNYQNFND